MCLGKFSFLCLENARKLHILKYSKYTKSFLKQYHTYICILCKFTHTHTYIYINIYCNTTYIYVNITHTHTHIYIYITTDGTVSAYWASSYIYMLNIYESVRVVLAKWVNRETHIALIEASRSSLVNFDKLQLDQPLLVTLLEGRSTQDWRYYFHYRHRNS